MESDAPPPQPPSKTYELTASSISYTKSITAATTFSSFQLLLMQCTLPTPICILKDISLTAYPSQILAIMGPNGVGKSTLLDILAARRSSTSGALLLNSFPISSSSFRKLSAYVPQYDACLPLLTVFETFAFVASLLIPNPNPTNVAAIVFSLLTELRLAHLSNTRLGQGLSSNDSTHHGGSWMT